MRRQSPWRWRTAVVVLTGCGLFPALASATREPTSFEELVADSEVIVLARVSRIAVDAQTAGGAVVQVLRVLKGTPSQPTLTLQWSDDPDEQRLTTWDQEHVLFLKRASTGVYQPARVGVSYWPVARTVGPAGLAVAYRFPLTLIAIPETTLLKPATFFAPSGERERAEAVYLDDLIAAISPPPTPPAAAPIQTPHTP